MKRLPTKPILPRAALAEMVERARVSEQKALDLMLDRKRVLVSALTTEMDAVVRQKMASKISDLTDAIRLRTRELGQLYPDRIKRIVKSREVEPKTSQQSENVAKVTWARPYRG